ncbi:TPA: ABC transporter permease [Candidatus Avacholeplasma faecigallinarum]|nr:ABC transporter permease [Candidatus Avacholeplasma faecigallinarum]
MQKNSTNLIPPSQTSHHLHRLAKPYLYWLYIFACFPLCIMFVLMFLDTEGIRLEGMSFTLANFDTLIQKSTIVAFFNSIKYSVLTTIICIFFGYLIAYSLYKSKIKNKYLILLLLILPMWTNVLLRINALASVFKENNILTDILGFGGVNIIGTDLAIILGMVFTYLPFIVLPIYTSLEKIDPSLHEAAMDLGVTEFTEFWKVTVPLSLRGVVSGSIMVLLPCLSGFAIPKILGEGNILLIGNIIEQSFINMSYNIGSVLAIVVLIIILGAILLVNKFDKEGETLL